MTVKIYCHDNLESLSPAQKAAFQEAARINYDLSLSWFRNLLATTFGPGQKLRIYVAEDEAGRFVVIPMCHDGGARPRRLRAVANFYTSLFAPVGSRSPGAGAELLTQALASIKDDVPRWDEVDLSPLAAEDESFENLRQALRAAGMLTFKYYRFGNWYLQVGGRSFAEYYENLPSRLKNTLRRKGRQFSPGGPGSLEIITGGARLGAAIAAYQKVYAASWKIPEPFPEFIPGLVRTCAENGWLRLGLAYVQGEPAAAQIWIVAHGRAVIFKLAYDEKYTRYSAGSVLSAHMMRHVLDVDKVREVDYLIGDDDYKKDWMSHRRERWGIVAYNPQTLNGLAGALKQAVGGWQRVFLSKLGHTMTPKTNTPRGRCADHAVCAGTEAKPRAPARPVLSLGDFAPGRGRAPGSVLDAGEARLTLNARTALAHALMHAGVGPGSSVLVPAYHCPAMVSPLAWLGVEPIFYPIRPDTTVDAEALARLARPDTRALVAVHFFGFLQDMGHLRKFCDERGLVLVEDCAHAFFGGTPGAPPGRWGDYAIASIMKFLPVYEGGCLVSSRRSLAGVETRQGGAAFQLKAALDAVEMAVEYGRLPWASALFKLKNALRRRKAGEGGPAVPSRDSPEFHFDPSKLHLAMPWAAVAITRGASFARACERRLANYQKLEEALGGIPGGRPLFADLPEGVYPQVFPLLVDAPEAAFPVLKRKRVPVIRFGEFRWKGVDASTCPVSEDYSRRVFQFPCHQSLSAEELDWMINEIASALAEAARTPPAGRG